MAMKKIGISLALIFAFFFMKAQHLFSPHDSYYGFHVGYSVNQVYNYASLYRPFILLFFNGFPLHSRHDEKFFSLYYEPQFNPVIFNNTLEVEFGINLGLSYTWKLGNRLQSFISLGTGPHYITVALPRQAPGFSFSDNIALGIERQIFLAAHSYNLNVQYRYRHVSNAGLRIPNGGINNGFLIVGLTREIQKPQKRFLRSSEKN